MTNIDSRATKKAPVKSAILIDYNQFNYLIIRYLLADADVGEDFTEDVVGGDFTSYFTKVMHTFADVLADEVSADSLCQTVDGSLDGFIGF